jgi:hypothetical protein
MSGRYFEAKCEMYNITTGRIALDNINPLFKNLHCLVPFSSIFSLFLILYYRILHRLKLITKIEMILNTSPFLTKLCINRHRRS